MNRRFSKIAIEENFLLCLMLQEFGFDSPQIHSQQVGYDVVTVVFKNSPLEKERWSTVQKTQNKNNNDFVTSERESLLRKNKKD